MINNFFNVKYCLIFLFMCSYYPSVAQCANGDAVIERYKEIIANYVTINYDFSATLTNLDFDSSEKLNIIGNLDKNKDMVYSFYSISVPGSEITVDNETLKNNELWIHIQNTTTKNSAYNDISPICYMNNKRQDENNMLKSCLEKIGCYFLPFGYISPLLKGDEMYFIPDILDSIKSDNSINSNTATYKGVYNHYLWTITISLENNMPITIEAHKEEEYANGINDHIKFNFTYKDIGGVFFPSHVEIHVSINNNDIKTSVNSFIIDYDYKKLSESDFSLSRLKTLIKNGTSIYMFNDPQSEYIWMDGKIVPKTDERMLAIAQGGHKFMPSPKESRFWLILLGIIGILGGGGWKIYDFWTSDRKSTSPNPKDQAA